MILYSRQRVGESQTILLPVAESNSALGHLLHHGQVSRDRFVLAGRTRYTELVAATDSNLSARGIAIGCEKWSFGMPDTNAKIFAVIALSSHLLIAELAVAQGMPSAFERCATYAAAFEELESLYDHYQAVREKLSVEHADALKRLSETNAAVRELVTFQEMRGLATLEAEMLSSGQQAALQSSSSPDGNLPSGHFLLGSRYSETAASAAASAARQIAQTRVQIDMLKHQMKTTDEAGRLVLERRKSVLEEIQSVMSEFYSLEVRSLELFNRYWELADVVGVRSGLELRAGRRLLQAAAADNPGAQFAHAITLMRLGEFDDPLAMLNRLANVPSVRGLVLAARAELHARMNKPDAALQDARQALSVARADGRVRVHRAMAFAALGDLKSAESEWEAVLKSGGHEIAARRAIALINASAANLTDRNKARAAESAELAGRLAGDKDWASNIAIALAAAANGETDKAIDAATRASGSAIGDKRLYCDGLREQMSRGARAVWKF